MPEEAQEVEENKTKLASEAPFLFVRMYSYNGSIREAIPVQTTDEAERLAADKRIWDDYGTEWFVAVPVRREVTVSYALPKPAESKPELAPLPVGMFAVGMNGNAQ